MSKYKLEFLMIFTKPFSSGVSDLDECAIHFHNDCNVNALCFNQPGTFQCQCKPGYIDTSLDQVSFLKVINKTKILFSSLLLEGNVQISVVLILVKMEENVVDQTRWVNQSVFVSVTRITASTAERDVRLWTHFQFYH